MQIAANPSPAEQVRTERDEALSGLVDAVLAALTGNAAQTLAKNATGLITLADRFSAPEVKNLLEAVLTHAGALTETMNVLGALVANGSLTKILELLGFVNAIMDSANGALVSTVAAKAVEMVSLLDQVAASSALKLVPSAVDALETAYQKSATQTGEAKIKDLIKLFRDPRTLANMKFALLFLQNWSIGTESRRA